MTKIPVDQDLSGASDSVILALRLVDRRPGAPMRANGRVLTIFTQDPEKTAAEALRDRDAAVWRVRAERLGTVEGALRG